MHPRQQDVQDREVVAGAAEQVERLLAVRAHRYFEAFAAEVVPEQVLDLPIVVHDQDAHRFLPVESREGPFPWVGSGGV